MGFPLSQARVGTERRDAPQNGARHTEEKQLTTDHSNPSSEPQAISGTILRSTSRGALVLETENARRMMQKLRNFTDSVEPDSPAAPDAAPAG